MSARIYEFGPFRLDADKAVLWRDGEVVSRTPKAPRFDRLVARVHGRG